MIDVVDVSFGYTDGPQVLRSLALSIDGTPLIAVLGPNGTGKTTFLKLVAGLLEPSEGTIEFDTTDPAVGLAPENPDDGLFAGSVRDEVAFFPKNRGLPVDERVTAALEAMEITDLADRVPQSLSEGEKRRVLLAAVLAGDPDLVTLDEPTSGLDVPARRMLGERLIELDRPVLFATHDTDFAWRYADQAVVLHEGEVHANGPVSEVLGPEGVDHEALGLAEPGPVRWARTHGFESPPESVAEAADWLDGGRT